MNLSLPIGTDRRQSLPNWVIGASLVLEAMLEQEKINAMHKKRSHLLENAAILEDKIKTLKKDPKSFGSKNLNNTITLLDNIKQALACDTTKEIEYLENRIETLLEQGYKLADKQLP